MTLNILIGYNNYYNRLLKTEATIEDYLNAVESNYTTFDVNFNPNDGINTEHIIGQGEYDGKGDYLVVTDDENQIVSRWFILEAKRTRAGQYHLLLRRDLIADYYNIIKDAPCLIEKSMLSPNSPLLFNKEDMTFNQIKTKEYLLKDKSGCPWLVGYYDKNMTNFNGVAKTNAISELNPIHVGPNFAEDFTMYEFTNLANKDLAPENRRWFGGPAYDIYLVIDLRRPKEGRNPELNWRLYIYGDLSYKLVPTEWGGAAFGVNITLTEQGVISRIESWLEEQKQLNQYNSNRLFVELANEFYGAGINGPTNEPALENFMFFDGKIFADDSEENIYYARASTLGNKEIDDYQFTYGGTNDIIIRQGLLKALAVTNADSQTVPYGFYCQYQAYELILEALSFEQVSYNIPDTGKLVTEDAPYNIFAIPYGDIDVIGPGELAFTTKKDTAFQVASAMAVNHGSFVYDIQLLPYCPIQSLLSDDGSLQVGTSDQYSLIGGVLGNESIILHVPASKIEFNIPLVLPAGQSALDKKVNNECDKWRLASPNYADFFDFSVEMNAGVEFFNIDCEFKPYTPYIHVNPNFKSLYGSDFNGPRGLVCGGDYSLSRVDNQWVNYQISNKNYEKIFGRQIQNLEVQQKAETLQSITSALVGTAQGAMSGAMIGNMAGGIAGGIVGGVVGGGLSAVAGAVDVQVTRMLQMETLDYTKDLYNYNLGNIQALPQTISKVSTFNNNNKIFPIIEYYTCTEVEKEMLRNKIKYNGMTTMVIGKINDAGSGYVKGKLIRIENSSEDFHLINSIGEEVNKGFFKP